MFLIFIDIFLCKMRIFLHLNFAFRKIDMQKDKAIENEQFWNRMDSLIDGERPYPWAEAKGINRSAFQSAKTRRTKPLPKTVRDWAEKIGCSYEWLNTGEGEAFPHTIVMSEFDKNKAESFQTVSKLHISESKINNEILEQCFESTDGALKSTFRTMEADKKAEFILQFYTALLDESGKALNIDPENFMLSVFTIEAALYYTRQTMSPKNKVKLISDIYAQYDQNVEMKNSTIQELAEYKKGKL